jgi:TPR repeat protein
MSKKAFKWFHKAAEKGHVEAMLFSGKFFISRGM